MQSKFTKDYIANIDDKIPQIIEYFVAFYGENFRAEITRKLTKTRFVFVGSDQSIIEYLKSKGGNAEEVNQAILEVQEKSRARAVRIERSLKEKNEYTKNIVNAITMYIKIEKGVDLPEEYKAEIENALKTQSAVKVNMLLNYYTYSFLQGRVPRIKPERRELYGIDNSATLGENVYNINSLDKIIAIINKTDKEIQALSKNYSLLYEDTCELLKPLETQLATNEYAELMQLVGLQDLLGEHCDALHMTAISKNIESIENIVFIKVNERMLDNVLIHELIHAVETHLCRIGENGVRFGSGLTNQTRYYNGDRVEIDYSSLDDQADQLLDEVMVDWRAGEIADMMYNDGFEIINNKNVSVSSYAECFASCDQLFSLIKPQINQFSFNGQKSRFVEFLGRDNFYTLANACLYMITDDVEEDLAQIKQENPSIEYDDQLIEMLDTIKTDNKYIQALRAIGQVTNSVEKKKLTKTRI